LARNHEKHKNLTQSNSCRKRQFPDCRRREVLAPAAPPGQVVERPAADRGRLVPPHVPVPQVRGQPRARPRAAVPQGPLLGQAAPGIPLRARHDRQNGRQCALGGGGAARQSRPARVDVQKAGAVQQQVHLAEGRTVNAKVERLFEWERNWIRAAGYE
jgi:hypothetical protein